MCSLRVRLFENLLDCFGSLWRRSGFGRRCLRRWSSCHLHVADSFAFVRWRFGSKFGQLFIISTLVYRRICVDDLTLDVL